MVKTFNLNNKIVLITGGYGYLGQAISESLIFHGATVYVLGRDEKKFEEAFKSIDQTLKLKLNFEKCDVANTLEIKNSFEKIHNKAGRIDVLINNAFYSKGQSPEKMTDEEWVHGIDGTLNTVFRCIREIIPYFKSQDRGKIINVSSMYGIVAPQFDAYEDFPDFINPPHYGAAKAGVIQLSRYYASYLGQFNINVNTVTPGPFPSSQVQKNDAFIKILEEKTCLKKIGYPEDLAGAFIFLSSDAADFITGQNLIIDGAGHANKKIAFIIQARMKSTRLPGKILLPIPLGNGKPLLCWILDELKSSKLENEIIIATSKNIENNILETFCKQQNIQCYRGEEEDVLSRFLAIIKQNEYDVIVRLTADNPFVDLTILEETIAYHLKNEYDYTKTEGLPLGMNFEIVSGKILLGIEKYDLSAADKEHVTLFIRNNSQYKKGVFLPIVNKELKNLRLTVDYASDFTLASTILSLSNNFDSKRGIKLIESVYAQYSWLFESNTMNVQKTQYFNISDEIKAAADLLENFDLKRAAAFLNKNAK